MERIDISPTETVIIYGGDSSGYSLAQIHKALAPTYFQIRRVSANMRRRIYAPDSETEIRLKIGFIQPT